MSTENHGHRDALHELLMDDDDDNAYESSQPLTRRQIRELERTTSGSSAVADEDEPAPRAHVPAQRREAYRVEYDETEADAEQERLRAEAEIRRMLDADLDDDDLPAPSPRATVASQADIEHLLGLDDDEDDFGSNSVDVRDNDERPAVRFPVGRLDSRQEQQQTPVERTVRVEKANVAVPLADDGGVDYEAWMSEDTSPPDHEPDQQVQVASAPTREKRATPDAVPEAHAGVTEAPRPSRARTEASAREGGEELDVDLVPEKRKLKAGLFAGKQERDDAREERDSVKRLNELKEKISAALVVEQTLAFRISDLQEEADTRQSLAEVREQLESASAQLQEVRNELDRASVRV